jgi:hypothetical protein
MRHTRRTIGDRAAAANRAVMTGRRPSQHACQHAGAGLRRLPVVHAAGALIIVTGLSAVGAVPLPKYSSAKNVIRRQSPDSVQPGERSPAMPCHL